MATLSAVTRFFSAVETLLDEHAETMKRARDLSKATGLRVVDAEEALRIAKTTTLTIDEAVRFVRSGIPKTKGSRGIGMNYTRNTTMAHRVTLTPSELTAVVVKDLSDKLAEIPRMSGCDGHILPPECAPGVRVMVRSPVSGPGLVELEAFLGSSAEIVVDWFEAFSDPVR